MQKRLLFSPIDQRTVEYNALAAITDYILLLDFVAGQVVKSLIGFSNVGSEKFIVTAIEASFRYML